MTLQTSYDWLTRVGNTWPALALGYRYEVQLGKMLDEKQITGEHLRPYLRNADVQWGRINVDGLPVMDFTEDARAKFSLRNADLLVCEGGEIGRAALWTNEPMEVYFQKALHRLRPRTTGNECPRFMFYALQVAAAANAYEAGGTTTIAHLPAEAFRQVKFPNPPLVAQTAIADYLDRKTAAIDALIAKKELLIEELRKYQEAMIAEAVAPREGWRAYKIKQLFKALPKSSLPSGAGDEVGPIPFYVSGEEAKRVTEAMHDGTALLLADGGKATLHLAKGSFAWSDHVVCLVSADSAVTEFVYNQLSVQRVLLDKLGFRGTGLPMLDKRWLQEDLHVQLPDSKDEMRALNERFRSLRAHTQRLTQNAQCSIRELQSYRAALISEAVMGKTSVSL